MDWLKVGLSVYLVVYVLGMALTAASVGKPRSPLEGRTAGVTMVVNTIFFIMLLLTWQRL